MRDPSPSRQTGMWRLCVVLFTLLGGCSTSLKYTNADKAAPVTSTALIFVLPDSKITLATSNSGTPGASIGTPGAAGGAAAAVNTPKSNCPKQATDSNWWSCFNQISAYAAMSPPKADAVTHVVTPADGVHLDLETTTITGTPITGQSTSYSQITVKYTSNVSAAITAAGTGAGTGIGLAGPLGALAGAGIGVAGVLLPGPGTLANVAVPGFPDYLCKDAGIDFTPAVSGKLKLTPALYQPVVISAADVRGASTYAPPSELTTVTSGAKDLKACWHILPNAGHLGEATPATIGGTQPQPQPQPPQDGDGWLFRVVLKTEDPTKPPPGGMAATDFFDGKEHDDFPLTACRQATMQITWWRELYNAVAQGGPNGTPSPRVVSFDTVVADPRYVTRAILAKGGVINFKQDCGATVSLTPDTSAPAILNATVTATENLYKAQQSWAAAQKKK